MFRKKFERESNYSDCKPYFYRFIGVEDTINFDNTLKTLNQKIDDNKDVGIIFDGSIPMSGEMELIQYIYSELNTINIYNMVSQDITLFDNLDVNLKFLRALDYVIPIAINNENFFSDNVRNNNITKLIVWVYSHIREIDFNNDISPKCVYYGKIERHEVYFLMLLYKMDFDIVYINPLKEEYFESIDVDKLSTIEKYMSIVQMETFAEKASRGKVLNTVETITKQLERDIEDQLFSNTGMYKPWQFRKGYTESLLLDTILEDIFIYWNEPAKLRTGFKVDGKLVSVPCFFKKVDGQYQDVFEYRRLVKHCIECDNSLFFNNGNFSNDTIPKEETYQLMFCQLSDGSFDIEEVKKLPIYRYSKYSIEVQNLILNKFNETILSRDIFTKKLEKEEVLEFLYLILTLNEDSIRSIDNFDFPAMIPKIVIYLDDEEK